MVAFLLACLHRRPARRLRVPRHRAGLSRRDCHAPGDRARTPPSHAFRPGCHGRRAAGCPPVVAPARPHAADPSLALPFRRLPLVFQRDPRLRVGDRRHRLLPRDRALRRQGRSVRPRPPPARDRIQPRTHRRKRPALRAARGLERLPQARLQRRVGLCRFPAPPRAPDVCGDRRRLRPACGKGVGGCRARGAGQTDCGGLLGRRLVPLGDRRGRDRFRHEELSRGPSVSQHPGMGDPFRRGFRGASLTRARHRARAPRLGVGRRDVRAPV